jgi:hypothetical protein
MRKTFSDAEVNTMGSLNGMSREAGNSYLPKETEMYRHLTNEELQKQVETNPTPLILAELLRRLQNGSAQLTPSGQRNTL